MSNQTDQFNKALRPEEVKSNPLHDEEDMYDVIHKTVITLCYVKGNDLGVRSYGIYIEDNEGLKKPIGIDITIWPDKSVHVQVADNALEILSFLKPELREQLEREENEEFERERRLKRERSPEYIAALEKQYEEAQKALQLQEKKVARIAVELSLARGEITLE